ncbi:glycine zipper 2TM domain-containing protein [Aquicella lusitana]|uniref:Osmotically inducible lipoprotein OsmB n=1 Tax=Aquicella lusitana TaxID=254246 RepID=A0A370GYK2_9COXI|nr:glycine zipper 2TM domain-containing protein [Aquicella lusitana]RDI48579.1 osmotically inducible lipoprotein OsmB [Aquicella lusitana]VVC74044.1 hypothetical protein AQULUS_18070 [Aquicella lusitana]
MNKILITLGTLVLAASLAGAACQRQDVGMVAGGVVGGAAGHELTGGSALGTVAGAVGGAYVGRELAR